MPYRRSTTRLLDQNTVIVSVRSNPEQTFTCVTKDVSETGLRLLSPKPLSVNTVVSIQIACGEPLKAFSFSGSVAWWQASDDGTSHMVGVRLVDAPNATLDHWKQVVDGKLLKWVENQKATTDAAAVEANAE